MPITKILLQGGAWTILGELGAIRAIHDDRLRADSVISKDAKLYGYSAGALTLLAYVCGLSGEEMLAMYDDLADVQQTVLWERWSLSPTMVHLRSFKMLFERCPDAFQKMNEHNCRVGVTTKNGFAFYKDFTSNRQLAEIMVASYHIPLFCTYEAKLEGSACMDGGVLFDKSRFIGDNADECLVLSNVPGITSFSSHVTIDIPKLFIAVPVPGPFQRYYFDRGYRLTKRYLEHPTYPLLDPETSKWAHLIDLVWFFRDHQTIEYDEGDLDDYVPRTAL